MTFDPYADRLPFQDIFTHSSSTTPSVKSEDSPTHPFAFTYPLHVDPAPNRPLFRFGMTDWPKRTAHPSIALDMTAIPFHDDYDDADESTDLPPISSPTSHAQSERIVRRRSSKGTPPCPFPSPADVLRSVRSVQEKQVQVRACCGQRRLQELHHAWYT